VPAAIGAAKALSLVALGSLLLRRRMLSCYAAITLLADTGRKEIFKKLLNLGVVNE
jgi:hypothetical protein